MKVNSLATKAIKIAIALASNNWSATAQPPPSDGQKDCRCNPDPHFKTWDNTYYDYHGECDLVLVKSNLLDVQIQTLAAPGYSLIEKVGLRVGGDEFTFPDDLPVPSTLGGYPITDTGSFIELTLDDGQFVRVTDGYGSLSVLVRGGPADFSDAVGMCGTWTTPGYIDRDGNPLVTDPPTEMGEEWAVIPSDFPIIPAQLATCSPALSFGEFCEGREDTKCLCDAAGTADGQDGCPCFDGEGEGEECLCEADACVTQDQIEGACADVEPDELKEQCKFDVQTTGNVDFGNAPFYQEPAPPLPDARCTSPPVELFKNKGIKCEDIKGAQCVFNCVTSRDFVCKPNLCGEVDGTPPFNNKKKGRCACKVPKHVMDSMCSDY